MVGMGGGGGGSDSVCLGKQILLLLISKCNADNETLYIYYYTKWNIYIYHIISMNNVAEYCFELNKTTDVSSCWAVGQQQKISNDYFLFFYLTSKYLMPYY